MSCTCPAGKPMWLSSDRADFNGQKAYVFEGYVKNCRECPVKAKCLRRENQKSPRSVHFFYSQMPERNKPDVLQIMKDKIDSAEGKRIYSKRLGTAEPPFGHMQEMGMTEFTLRGREKVNGQWRLMCCLHNLKKIHSFGGESLARRMEKAV
ncbi:transposase [Endozoicomonas gorgoniicola]|uniref:Transposase n=1 Tax=Endozoicomonas gorgoniicola TaxID=1234144 RepID=A0ABT3MTM9_9GAMM|nr:transposase [Endozoicomonas gorgoniicola]MCW7552742.1 transposase [Endozoicomonas gorgoniicola]